MKCFKGACLIIVASLVQVQALQVVVVRSKVLPDKHKIPGPKLITPVTFTGGVLEDRLGDGVGAATVAVDLFNVGANTILEFLG